MTSKSQRHTPAVGDVYAVRLPDGRFGAMRILAIDGKRTLASTQSHLSTEPPTPDDASAFEPVTQVRFSCRGTPDITWYSGKLPEHLAFAFGSQLQCWETPPWCGAYGFWSHASGIAAYQEWRWVHDRPAFEAEVNAQIEEQSAKMQQRLRAMKPKRMLPEARFRALIASLDWSRAGDDDAVLAPLRAALAALPKPDIRGFQERLAWCLYQLDTREHARHVGDGSWTSDDAFFSVDGFLYARCCAVANGQAFYEAALADPARMPEDLEFEALLYVASEAWEDKTGGEFDHETGCSFETFSNLEGWSDEA